MELKHYQKRVLADLDLFMDKLKITESMELAYAQTWLENGIMIGATGLPPYQNTLPGVPHVCFKVPTAGGKTILGCAALKHIFDNLQDMAGLPISRKVVVWLVPSNAILEQTLAALRNPYHDYRQQIDKDFGSRVEVYSGQQVLNAQNFSPTTVQENLTLIVLSFDALRIKRKEGRKAYQENASLEPFVSSFEHPETLIPDVEDNALMQVLNQLSPVVVVDESHNAQSDLSIEMLKNLNPSFVLDLTATPRKSSNLISIVSAQELKKANMVKLPVVVYNRPSQQDVVDTAIYLRQEMEERATAESTYIRPIVLFQAEPRISGTSTTFLKLRDKLIACGIPANQIAIKTSEINELKGQNLLSPECPIRFIITVNALKEGWDCPFAYILATLANRSSQVDVEQIVGRILRLPYVRRHRDPMLNMSYVLTSSADFMTTVSSVVKGLNQAGFTDKDCRSVDAESEMAPMTQNPTSPVSMKDGPDDTGKQTEPAIYENTDAPCPRGENDDASGSGEVSDIAESPLSSVYAETAEDDEFDFDPALTRQHGTQSGAIKMILTDAENKVEEYEKKIEEQDQKGTPAQGGDEMRRRFEMQKEYEIDAASLKLPVFVRNVGVTLFSDSTTAPVTKESLTAGFTLADKDAHVDFTLTDATVTQVDVGNDSRPRVISLSEKEALRLKEYIKGATPAEKRGMIIQTIFNLLNRLNFVSAGDLRTYIQRVVDNLTESQLETLENMTAFYANRIKDKVNALADEYREKRFYQMLEIGSITAEPYYTFPKQITPLPTMPPLNKALYTDEADVNKFEMRVIQAIAGLDNVVWWHRNIERTGFSLNGSINHYPDFIVRTEAGKVILVEAKGDDRDNSDSQRKVRLGRKWAECAGTDYKYYMVFDEKNTGFEGAYTLSEFLEIMKQM